MRDPFYSLVLTRVLAVILHRGTLLLVLCVFQWACATATFSTAGADAVAGRTERFTILTYNVLHGLEVGRFWVKQGESNEERAARFALQFEQLARVAPDVVLLQEVNPLPDMAEAYVEGLAGFDMKYRAVHQADACGVRVGSRLGLVPGLNNGLAVLAKAPLELRKLAGLKLSGGFGGCGALGGFQTGAFRYALIAEVEHLHSGKKLIVVSLHLHSGIERNEYFIQRILEAKEQGQIEKPEEFEKLLAALAADQERRLRELRTLLGELRRLKDRDDYLAVVIGGDFNFEPDSPEYRELKAAGLRDSHTMAQPDRELHTYDPQNSAGDRDTGAVPGELTRAIAGLPERRQQAILAEYRKGVSQARRIDFLFTMPGQSGKGSACVRQELFGTPTAVSVETGSDHYGVLNLYTFDQAGC
jgi:endonuclease/exonuclease/phosphatase family metal-dependent hydrolase